MKRKKNTVSRLGVLALAFVFVCLAFAPQGFAKTITIKMGSIDPPLELSIEKTNGEFASTHIKCQSFKSTIERMTRGRIKVSIFPSGQLGSEMEALEMLRSGAMDMSGYPGGPLPNFAPEVLAIQIPYLFKDINVAKKVLSGPLGDELAESIAKKSGIRVLAWSFEGPYYNFMSAKKPIRVPSDLKGQKLRTLQTPNLMEIVRTAGGTPTPIAYSELYTSLQQGVVDGCITAIPFVRSIKLDEVLKYINKSDFYLGMSNLYVSEKFWNKLSAKDKALIKDAALQAITVFEGMTLWGENLWVDYFRGEGLEVYIPTPKEMKIWKDTLHDHMVDWTKKKIGSEWVDKFLKASEKAEKELYPY
ncbi:MAG: TRAP transporter substrate-binding protein [Deltaproteobacteria bacterium]|nr:TRAP transporter substrate-binding protein [Deltaproteobacteria bacterium]